MGLKLILLLLINLHLVLSTQQLHEYEATNPHHSRARNQFSIAIPPSKSTSGVSESTAHSPSESSSSVPVSIAMPPSKPIQRTHARKWTHSSVDSPVSHHKHHHSGKRSGNRIPAAAPAYPIHPPTYSYQGPSSVSKLQPPFSSPNNHDFRAPAPSPVAMSSHLNVPSPSPRISPLSSSFKKAKAQPPAAYSFVLPPPPPNKDCLSMTCSDPLTYTPPGSPCGCVLPLQVKLQIGIAISKFFPLVTKLAEEVAVGLSLNRSQVRIVGADAANLQLEKTNVLINLVPTGVKFNDTIAFSIYQKFWHKKVLRHASLFGAYEVLYVQYPGLPPSPPSASGDIDNGPYTGGDSNGTIMKPLGVDVSGKTKGESNNGRMIVVIVLSSVTAFVIFIGLAWLALLKYRSCVIKPEQGPDVLVSPSSKQSGTPTELAHGKMQSSGSLSFNSGSITYTGAAKIFSLNELEKATNNFDSSRILGEGGFGLVYKGILNDGRDIAVKILKRDDQRGGREFLAEVEMLSRLHHRNLVTLLGICIERKTRCLVYELVPNGSVESHLHGADKETSPLDWNSRMKIALGAARGLAYLHEDSNPCVIHRDFKSSNILLEDDFTPKVSDFGLARTALDEGNKHISTHVMGTFGYLAPEYAMTGHLLVKSDVYSYGVVLLELLTGRKPVDFSQPPGQENLVNWARPLLTSKQGLEMIIDPVVKPSIPADTMLKVSAIASMCVQPEVSQRPFMGEVVQALKLVALSATDLLSTSGQEFESFRRHSSSGPLTSGRKKKFWQKLRSMSRGSTSEHGFSTKLWPGSH
ncbi:hypothetical protein PIB30_045352 [Stylosanthes scabra]|uniref:Protein kinase domain-containing protein n=1 Tax=Stylosanthes scabra TaxID=79078 RepID=A0ABU6RGA2_9FABA|nr:hypothetical protein [Stylosanthes scabra]